MNRYLGTSLLALALVTSTAAAEDGRTAEEVIQRATAGTCAEAHDAYLDFVEEATTERWASIGPTLERAITEKCGHYLSEGHRERLDALPSPTIVLPYCSHFADSDVRERRYREMRCRKQPHDQHVRDYQRHQAWVQSAKNMMIQNLLWQAEQENNLEEKMKILKRVEELTEQGQSEGDR